MNIKGKRVVIAPIEVWAWNNSWKLHELKLYREMQAEVNRKGRLWDFLVTLTVLAVILWICTSLLKTLWYVVSITRVMVK